MRTRILVGVLVSALLATAGWFFGVRHGDGPLGESALGDELCFPVGTSETATVALTAPLRNGSSGAVRITDVSLIDPSGVEYAGALLLPDAQKNSATSKSGWSFGDGPFDISPDRPRFAVDGDLAAKSPVTWLVIQVRRPDIYAEGHLTGIRIEYYAGLRRYALETGPEHTLRPGRCS
ncbi:hypothetical protein ACFVWG_10835 [Kribbella sp. NPDC058245]|uniref:hypothetical protein n=1 Tax=Kribbella sp. NPDC058245 TaxID=3346399 RepID=UPI0036E8D93C